MFYVGLDVSSARVAVCVVDDEGVVVLQRSVGSTPSEITEMLAPFGAEIERIGLEAGPTSPWLARGLRALGLPAIVIDATHAAATLRAGFRNKTDRNDARGLADMMRVRTFRSVWVKSPEAQRERAPDRA